MSVEKAFADEKPVVVDDYDVAARYRRSSITDTGKTKVQRLWPAFAAGAGLFSDGYLQSVIGPVIHILGGQYPDAFKTTAAANISSIAFAGTVVGQLIFGWTSDSWSRKWSLVVSTVILIVFAILASGAWGAGGSISGLIAALIAYRFLLGIGIGGEYPAGSVGCAESTGELQPGSRNRWFALMTNCAIDVGFVAGSLIPTIIAAATSNGDQTLVWRLSLGLGAIPPLSLLWLRIKYQEPESTRRENFRSVRVPWGLTIRFYGPRLLLVSAIWFIYDFLTYPFSIYSSAFISVITPNASLWQVFGWSTAINAFYLPGAFIGALIVDKIGPRRQLMFAVAAQGVVGFIMAGCYKYLRESTNIAAFVIVYGIFLSLGEVGPGDNIGLIASKTSATGIRGRYYGIAAACGKIGGFVGNYVFPYVEQAGGKSTSVAYGQYPFWLASSLCFFSAFLAFWLPTIGQDSIETEDRRFREYLIANGFDVSQMGDKQFHGIEDAVPR